MWEQPTSEGPESATAAAGRRWKWLGPLLAVHAVAALLTVLSMTRGPSGDLHEILVSSVIISQGSLLGMWAALGGRPLPWRLVAAAVALVALMRLLEGWRDMEVWIWFLLLQMTATCLPLLALRLRGVELAACPPHDPPRHPPRQWPKMQFSLGSLLAWTTALAVLMGMFEMTTEKFRSLFTDAEYLIIVLLVFGGGAPLSLATLWFALGTRWMPVRVVVFTLAGLGFLVAMWSLGGPPKVGWIVLFPFLSVVWLLGSLLVFRFAGYRLVWRRTE